MQEVHALYKLIILYMLNKVEFALTNSQISAFILEAQYTDYFTLQETLSDMVESKLLEPQTIRNSTHYSLTDIGRETLEYFGHRISKGIQDDVAEYLKKNKLKLRNENAVIADYFNNTNGEFTVRLQVKEKDAVLIDLSLSVPLEQQAILLCDNWQKKNAKVYKYLMKELMNDETTIDRS